MFAKSKGPAAQGLHSTSCPSAEQTTHSAFAPSLTPLPFLALPAPSTRASICLRLVPLSFRRIVCVCVHVCVCAHVVRAVGRHLLLVSSVIPSASLSLCCLILKSGPRKHTERRAEEDARRLWLLSLVHGQPPPLFLSSPCHCHCCCCRHPSSSSPSLVPLSLPLSLSL